MRAFLAALIGSLAFVSNAAAMSPGFMPLVVPAIFFTSLSLEPVRIAPPNELELGPAYLPAFQMRLDEVASRDYMAGLAVAVIEDGELVLVYTSGETAFGSGEAITDHTLFRAASVSKGMTGTLMALLEDEGRLDLSQIVPREILPLPQGRSATALQVLAHQTGLTPYALDRSMERGLELYELRERMPQQRTTCRPGQCYSYQNVAYSSLETLAAQAAGMPFELTLDAWLFERLGMHDATVGVDDLITAQNWARPHRRRERVDGVPTPGDPETAYDRTLAAAGVNVSLRDMIAYAEAHLGVSGRLPAHVRERIQTRQVETPSQTRRLYRLAERINSTGYGLGFRSYDWNGHELLNHSGYLSGYGAQIYMEPDTGFAFVALWNADGDAPWWIFPTLMDMRTGDGPGDWLDEID